MFYGGFVEIGYLCLTKLQPSEVVTMVSFGILGLAGVY